MNAVCKLLGHKNAVRKVAEDVTKGDKEMMKLIINAVQKSSPMDEYITLNEKEVAHLHTCPNCGVMLIDFLPIEQDPYGFNKK